MTVEKNPTPAEDNASPHKRRVAPLVGAFAAGAVIFGTAAYVFTAQLDTPKNWVAVAGVVTCPEDQPVTGVWVEPTGGQGRGWARWTADPEQRHIATFTKAVGHSASSYRLDVGCGGTPAHWEHNNSTPQIPNTAEHISATCTDQVGVKVGSCVVGPLVRDN